MVSVMEILRFKRKGKMVEIARSGNRFVARGEMDRLLSKIKKVKGCWIWTDTPASDGYGKFQASSGKTERAHRASWRIHKGEIQQGLYCLHKCDHPLCVNPDHLFLGTQADNIKDMISKGRRPRVNAKINEAQAATIKGRLAMGESPARIASEMEISRSIVYQIKYGKTWRDVIPSSTL
jgi:hypothetical protein